MRCKHTLLVVEGFPLLFTCKCFKGFLVSRHDCCISRQHLTHLLDHKKKKKKEKKKEETCLSTLPQHR